MITLDAINEAPQGCSQISGEWVYKARSGRAYVLRENGAHPLFLGANWVFPQLGIRATIQELESADSNLKNDHNGHWY